jgi:hypothetical protein
MTQFSFKWILSLNWLSQNWGQVQNAFAIPGHVFVKIQLNGDTMRTALLNPDWAEKAADLKTLGLSHMRIGGKVVLTATTQELQDLVVRYAGDKSVFGSGSVLNRLK